MHLRRFWLLQECAEACNQLCEAIECTAERNFQSSRKTGPLNRSQHGAALQASTLPNSSRAPHNRSARAPRFPTLRKVRKEKRKFQSPRLAVCSQINGKRLLLTALPPPSLAPGPGDMTQGGEASYYDSPSDFTFSTELPPPTALVPQEPPAWGLVGHLGYAPCLR